MAKPRFFERCPVCGYLLDFLPWGVSRESASHEICPCCGTEFGFHDDALLDNSEDREKAWAKRRKQWIDGGMKWWSSARNPPPNWNPAKQLTKLDTKKNFGELTKS